MQKLIERLKHMDTDWDIEFHENDAYALASLVERSTSPRPVVIELGSWKGCSSAIIARVLKPRGGQLWCVDTWKGSADVPHHEQAKYRNIFYVFDANMQESGLADVVHPVMSLTQVAAGMFRDGSADLIFIDADHRYSSVKADIAAYLPKLRAGGILCGHDWDWDFNEPLLPLELDKPEYLEVDTVPYHGGHLHAGVIKAVIEANGSPIKGSSIWMM